MNPIIAFLATGWGTLLTTGLGVVLILVAVFRQPRRIHILDYVEFDNQSRAVIQDETFEHCDISGPAVLHFVGGANFFDRCVFESNKDSQFITVHPDQKAVAGGVVVMRNCIFRKCTFKHTSIIGNKEDLKRFEELITEIKGEGVEIRLK